MFRAAVGFVSSQAKMAKKQEKCCRTAKLRLASPRGVGGGTPHMKLVGMLVVSLRGVNFGFWSHLGYSGPSYLAVKVSFRVTRENI